MRWRKNAVTSAEASRCCYGGHQPHLKSARRRQTAALCAGFVALFRILSPQQLAKQVTACSGRRVAAAALRPQALQLTFVVQVIMSLKSDNPATVATAGNIRRAALVSISALPTVHAHTTTAIFSSPSAIYAVYFSISYSTTQPSQCIQQCIGLQPQMHSPLSPFPCPILPVLSASI